jgi:hypothetical protein
MLSHGPPDTLDSFRRLRPRAPSAMVLTTGEPPASGTPDCRCQTRRSPTCFAPHRGFFIVRPSFRGMTPSHTRAYCAGIKDPMTSSEYSRWRRLGRECLDAFSRRIVVFSSFLPFRARAHDARARTGPENLIATPPFRHSPLSWAPRKVEPAMREKNGQGLKTTTCRHRKGLPLAQLKTNPMALERAGRNHNLC